MPFRHLHKLKPYLDAIVAGGMDPVPADVSGPVSLGDVHGLVLMGGTDVNPNRYAASAWAETDTPDDVRDQAELDLIDAALSKDLPLFAICRGLQILNVYHGGTLVQHLSSASRHDVENDNKAQAAHEILISPGSLLGEIADGLKWSVNSRHHQAADRVGQGLRVTARDAEDGTIEALERPDKPFVLAVQWHPEDQVGEFPEQVSLFRAFSEAL